MTQFAKQSPTFSPKFSLLSNQKILDVSYSYFSHPNRINKHLHVPDKYYFFFAKVVEVVPQKSPLEGIDEFES